MIAWLVGLLIDLQWLARPLAGARGPLERFRFARRRRRGLMRMARLTGAHAFTEMSET